MRVSCILPSLPSNCNVPWSLQIRFPTSLKIFLCAETRLFLGKKLNICAVTWTSFWRHYVILLVWVPSSSLPFSLFSQLEQLAIWRFLHQNSVEFLQFSFMMGKFVLQTSQKCCQIWLVFKVLVDTVNFSSCSVFEEKFLFLLCEIFIHDVYYLFTQKLLEFFNWSLLIPLKFLNVIRNAIIPCL